MTKKIVPGSVGNKIRQFEVIHEEKKKEKIPPAKITRRAFRSRVNSTQVYRRDSLALLASNTDSNLRIQTVISQLFNNQNEIPSSSTTPVTPGNRISSFKNQLSNNEMTMETFFKKIRESNGEIDEEDEEKVVESETNPKNDSDTDTKSNSTESPVLSPIKSNDETKFTLIKRNSHTRSSEYKHYTTQDSPLRISSKIPESENDISNEANESNNNIDSSDNKMNDDNKINENNNENNNNNMNENECGMKGKTIFDGTKSSDSLPDKPILNKFRFQSQQNVYDETGREIGYSQTLSLSSNELVNSETDDSTNKLDVIPPLKKKQVAASDTQLNTTNGVKKFKTQFIKLSSKKNSRANIKSIHVKGNGEHSNSNSQENIMSSCDSISRQESVSDDSISSLNNINNIRKISSDQAGTGKAVEVIPLKINTKMTSDTNLYSKNNEMMLSSKSSKSFVAIPTLVAKKQVNKSNKSVEMRHITKKSSFSTISSHSDDSINSPISSVISDRLQSPLNEKRMSKLNEYDTDILYEYFEEESMEDMLNSEGLSIRSLSVDSSKNQYIKPGSLSIKTNIKQNAPGLASSDIMTSGVTPLDQVYSSISEELEQRLCKTVRHSVLQRVDSNNFMIPINILYDKHYKTQVIYVERKMTIEEVLHQALNSIDIFEDYGNYELLQVFGFEDIIEEEEEDLEEGDENKKGNEKEKTTTSLESNEKYQNVLDPSKCVENILEETLNGSKRKTNNILTFRIRKKSSTMKLSIYIEEEKRYYKIMVTKTTTSNDVIEALLFLINEPFSDNWFIQRKHVDNYEEGKEILEPDDVLYNKDEKIKYILKRKVILFKHLTNNVYYIIKDAYNNNI